AVGAPGLVGLALPVEVIEVDPAHPVPRGGDGDHASGDNVQQQVGQREVAEVVGAELELEAVDGARQRGDHHAGVVDQEVDVALPCCGEAAHGGDVREVELSNVGVAWH